MSKPQPKSELKVVMVRRRFSTADLPESFSNVSMCVLHWRASRAA